MALVIALLASCTSGRGPPHPETATYPVMSLVGRFGIGHACPVAGQILTAAHVAFRLQPSGPPIVLSYAYSAGELAGFVSPKWALSSRDIAGLQVDSGDLPPMNELAERSPIAGERIYWQEYRLEGPGVLAVERREAEITSVAAGHGSIARSARPGASGSCAFDARGQVVGLVVWELGIPPRREGVVVLLTERWWPVAQRPIRPSVR